MQAEKGEERKIKYCYCIIEYEDGQLDAGFLKEFEGKECSGKIYNIHIEHDILARWYPKVFAAFIAEYQAQQKINIMKRIIEDAREFIPSGNPILEFLKDASE